MNIPGPLALDVAQIRATGPHLSVAINAADLSDVRGAVGELESGGARFVHVDVMDGHFTPQLTVGPAFIGAIRTWMLKDVHLLIADPLASLGQYVAAGADLITIHAEATSDPTAALRAISAMAQDRGRRVLRGLAISPGTPLDVVARVIDEVDHVVVLAIDPVRRGPLIAATAQRVAAVRALIDASARPVMLGVDGGVTRENIATVATFGADLVVSGSAIFDRAATARENLAYMQGCLAAARPRAEATSR